VPRPAIRARVQQADIEKAGSSSRVIARKIVRHFARGKSLAVDGHPEILQVDGFRLLVREHPHVGRQPEAFRDLAGGVVIARHDENRNVRLRQPGDLPREKEAGVVILPVAVVDIAGDHHERHLLRDGQVDDAFQRATRGRTEPLHRRTLVSLQPVQRAIEMDVGDVQELH
jgi:hypothetical protein